MSAEKHLIDAELEQISYRLQDLGLSTALLDYEIPSQYDQILRNADEINLLEVRQRILECRRNYFFGTPALEAAATQAPQLEVIPAQPRSLRIRRKHLTLIHSKT